MIQYLQNLSFWDWLALATILLICSGFIFTATCSRSARRVASNESVNAISN